MSDELNEEILWRSWQRAAPDLTEAEFGRIHPIWHARAGQPTTIEILRRIYHAGRQDGGADVELMLRPFSEALVHHLQAYRLTEAAEQFATGATPTAEHHDALLHAARAYADRQVIDDGVEVETWTEVRIIGTPPDHAQRHKMTFRSDQPEWASLPDVLEHVRVWRWADVTVTTRRVHVARTATPWEAWTG